MNICFLKTKRLSLSALEMSDVSDNYISWLNNENVCEHNDHHFFPYTKKQAEEYISSTFGNKDMIVLKMVETSDNVHIGNISLYEINYIYRSAGIGILIGEEAYWGKGYAQEAIESIVGHAFLSLGLNRLFLGTSEKNIGMQKVALKLRMTQEGVKRKALYKNGEFLDFFMFSILREEYLESLKPGREREPC